MARIALRPINLDRLSARFKRMAAALPGQVQDGLKDAATDMMDDFKLTTETWAHQPTFEINKINKGYEVVTKDPIWIMLNHGTPPHEITASGPGRPLIFSSAFTAKTRVGWIGSREGGGSGDSVFAYRVQHPGTAPRSWEFAIEKKWHTKAATYVRNRLKQSVEAPGL